MGKKLPIDYTLCGSVAISKFSNGTYKLSIAECVDHLSVRFPSDAGLITYDQDLKSGEAHNGTFFNKEDVNHKGPIKIKSVISIYFKRGNILEVDGNEGIDFQVGREAGKGNSVYLTYLRDRA